MLELQVPTVLWAVTAIQIATLTSVGVTRLYEATHGPSRRHGMCLALICLMGCATIVACHLKPHGFMSAIMLFGFAVIASLWDFSPQVTNEWTPEASEAAL